MDIGEAVNVAVNLAGKSEEEKCDKKDEDPGHQSRVNKFNSQADCTGTRLYSNLKGKKSEHESKGLGVVPDGSPPAGGWKLAKVTPTSFPVQAHHLIPKNFLPTHKVCTFLALKYKQHDKYELKFDSSYDTDDPDNGYCMPYATPLAEWKKARTPRAKVAIAYAVMDQTGIQLHQGSHPFAFDPKKINEKAGADLLPEDAPGGADSDDDEQDEIESPGYLNACKRLLGAVYGSALAHIPQCPICGKEASGKKKLIMPRKQVVENMHRVSAIIKVLADGHVIFVSGYAYASALTNKQIFFDGERYRISAHAAEELLSKFDKIGG